MPKRESWIKRLINKIKYLYYRSDIDKEIDRSRKAKRKEEKKAAKAEKKIIYTTISSKELPSLLYHVHATDPKAFVSVLDATDVYGEGFNSLREKALH